MKHSKFLFLAVIGAIAAAQTVCGVPVEGVKDGEISASFGFKQDNGYQRVEEVTYNKTAATDQSSEKPVEFKGGYSYISDDGYEYTVKYKANKNGFQPYVTAHKLNNNKNK